jgi:hypothetical protein
MHSSSRTLDMRHCGMQVPASCSPNIPFELFVLCSSSVLCRMWTVVAATRNVHGRVFSRKNVSITYIAHGIFSTSDRAVTAYVLKASLCISLSFFYDTCTELSGHPDRQAAPSRNRAREPTRNRQACVGQVAERLWTMRARTSFSYVDSDGEFNPSESF